MNESVENRSMDRPVRILLVDDHPIFRAGIRALLESEADRFRVVGEAGSGEEALEKVEELQPDVVVMDLAMPGMGGLEATRRVTSLDLDVEVLVLTVHGEEEYLKPVLDAGASGYLTKDEADRDLLEALAEVGRGRVYLPGDAKTLLLRSYHAGRGEEPAELADLSAREREVLGLTAEGFSAREIGEQLGISPKTVDTYRSRLTDKLGLTHRAELFRFAMKAGLLEEG